MLWVIDPYPCKEQIEFARDGITTPKAAGNRACVHLFHRDTYIGDDEQRRDRPQSHAAGTQPLLILGRAPGSKLPQGNRNHRVQQGKSVLVTDSGAGVLKQEGFALAIENPPIGSDFSRRRTDYDREGWDEKGTNRRIDRFNDR